MNRRQRQGAILTIYILTCVVILSAMFGGALPPVLAGLLVLGGWALWLRESKRVPVDRQAKDDPE